jgi:hypothetical protein
MKLLPTVTPGTLEIAMAFGDDKLSSDAIITVLGVD